MPTSLIDVLLHICVTLAVPMAGVGMPMSPTGATIANMGVSTAGMGSSLMGGSELDWTMDVCCSLSSQSSHEETEPLMCTVLGNGFYPFLQSLIFLVAFPLVFDSRVCACIGVW